MKTGILFGFCFNNGNPTMRRDAVIVGTGDVKQVDAIMAHVPDVVRAKARDYFRPFVEGKRPHSYVWTLMEDGYTLSMYYINNVEIV